MRGGALIAAAALALLASPAAACFYHALANHGFAVAHPSSIPVAVATRAAQERGLLPPVPRDDRRALTRLAVLNAYLPVTAADTLASRRFHAFSILQLQSQTWTRYAPAVGEALIETHRAGPDTGDAIVVLADTTLRALLAGGLELDYSIAAGLVAITGPEATRALLAELVDDFRQSAVGRVACRGGSCS